MVGYSINPVSDGKSYQRAVGEIGKIKILLSENGIKDADFIQTDFFIAYLFYQVFDLQGKRRAEILTPVAQPAKELAKETGKPPALVIDTHESAEAALFELGNLLGYDTYTPDASRTYNEKKLGELATPKELPYFTTEKIMSQSRTLMLFG